MPAEQSTGQAGRVLATASRLRMVQVHCADQPDDVRRKYLESEMDEALKRVDPSERRVFLERLLQEFPAWETRVEQPQVVQSDFDKSQLNDPDFLVQSIKRLAPALTDEKKRLIAQELAQSGMSMVGTPDWPKAAAEELRLKIGIGATESIDANRVLELLSLLVEFTLHVEQAAWATWKDLDGAAGPVKQPGALKGAFRKCIAGDPNTPRPMVAIGSDRLKQLVASFINVLLYTGQYAFNRHKAVAPGTIRRALEIENQLPWMNPEKALWARYVEESEALDEEGFRTAIRKDMAEQIRKWMTQTASAPLNPR